MTTRVASDTFTLKDKSFLYDNNSTHEREICMDDLPDLPFKFPQSESAVKIGAHSHSSYKLNNQTTSHRSNSVAKRTEDSRKSFGARCA